MHSIISPANCEFVSNHQVSPVENFIESIDILRSQKWTSTLIKAVLVVTLSTSFVMGVNIGGPNVYNSVDKSEIFALFFEEEFFV